VKVKVFWFDSLRQVGIDAVAAVPMTREQAYLDWFDKVPGVPGSFLGLVDSNDQTLQFYVAGGIPDDVDDAGPLACIDLDIPVPGLSGSYSARIRFMDVEGIIARVYERGVDPEDYNVTFSKW
jgi:hypothetical protein